MDIQASPTIYRSLAAGIGGDHGLYHFGRILFP